MTSFSVSNLVTAAIGPNVSSLLTSASLGTCVIRVGWKKLGPKPGAILPPASTDAPLDTASSTCSLTLITPLSLIRGPMSFTGSMPCPNFNVLTFSASFAQNVSYMPDWTNILLALTHVWPVFLNISRIEHNEWSIAAQLQRDALHCGPAQRV